MIKTTVTASVSGPANQSSAVQVTQPTVLMARSFFFAACASAQAPMSGAVSMMRAYDTDSAAVQARVAQAALAATTDTK